MVSSVRVPSDMADCRAFLTRLKPQFGQWVTCSAYVALRSSSSKCSKKRTPRASRVSENRLWPHLSHQTNMFR